MRKVLFFAACALGYLLARRWSVEIDKSLGTQGPDDEEDNNDLAVRMAPYPHCDSSILHAPGVCEYCDMYPGRQQGRITLKVNFTGQYLPGYSPCPSELARPIEVINRWPGNRASLK